MNEVQLYIYGGIEGHERSFLDISRQTELQLESCSKRHADMQGECSPRTGGFQIEQVRGKHFG